MKWKLAAVALAIGGLIGVAHAQWTPTGQIPTFYYPSTGANTQTFTNSPCSSSTTSEQWIPIKIFSGTGTNSTYYVPACQ